jgi:hypothetical protein
MMLITDIEIDLTSIGVGCSANVIVRRSKEATIVPCVMYTPFKDVNAYEIMGITNETIKRFFEMCKREYDQHIISDRDREITSDYLRKYPAQHKDAY